MEAAGFTVGRARAYTGAAANLASTVSSLARTVVLSIFSSAAARFCLGTHAFQSTLLAAGVWR